MFVCGVENLQKRRLKGRPCLDLLVPNREIDMHLDGTKGNQIDSKSNLLAVVLFFGAPKEQQ